MSPNLAVSTPRIAFSIALACAAVAPPFARSSTAADDATASSGTGAAADLDASGFVHESAFDDYVPWTEDERPGWVEANDRVGEIGGWRTYAKERFESMSADEAVPEAGTDDADDADADDGASSR